MSKSIFDKKMTRRQFIKGGIIAAAGIGVGMYALGSLLNIRPLSSTFRDSAPADLWKWSKECYHYLKLGSNAQCQVCPNKCVLRNNERSVCRLKVNKDGKLYTLAYGNPCSANVDPIEKKPLFHFLPATGAFSIATAGCTFRCLNCQNWQISQSMPEETKNMDMFPDAVVENAIAYNCSSIAYTYSEPTAFFEYMYDTSKLAREKGLKNLWITNGSINRDALMDLCKYIDAANVDLKSFSEGIYNELNAGRLQPVLDSLKTLKEQNVWFEVTNLVIPTYTDDMDMIREMCKWIVANIGPDYPLHFSRFTPMYKLKALPQTPVRTLEDAHNIAKEEGIKYAYIGNVPGHRTESTVCPECNKTVIGRKGYLITENNLQNSSCKFCGEPIAGVWKP